jgi:hypothetical protein
VGEKASGAGEASDEAREDKRRQEGLAPRRGWHKSVTRISCVQKVVMLIVIVWIIYYLSLMGS